MQLQLLFACRLAGMLVIARLPLCAAHGNVIWYHRAGPAMLMGMVPCSYARLFMGCAGPLPRAHEFRREHRLWVSSSCCTALFAVTPLDTLSNKAGEQTLSHGHRVKHTNQHTCSGLPSNTRGVPRCATYLTPWGLALTEVLQDSARQLGPVVEARNVLFLCQHRPGVLFAPRVGSSWRLPRPQQYHAGAQLRPDR